MPFLTADYLLIIEELAIILGWVILAGFTGYWTWLFYNQLAEGKDPMAAPFMLREIAYTNMFICYAVILSVRVLGFHTSGVVLLAWGTVSTLLVVASYFLLHRELNRQKGQKKL